jgi:phosphatidylglycerophosphate synthase
MSWLSEYKNSLKMIEVEEIFDLYFYRPLAFIIVKIVLPTNITPNQLTLSAIVMGILGGYFYANGSPYIPYSYILGAVFYALFNILDCSDGMLARIKKNGTYTGRIIDGLADYIAAFAIFIGIGIGFCNNTNHPVFWWVILLLSGISNIVHSVLVDYYRNRFLDHVLVREKTLDSELDTFQQEFNKIKDQKNKWFDKILIGLYLRYAAFQDKMTTKPDIVEIKISPEVYYEKNKSIIRSWVILGPTTQITLLIICSIFNRFDIFFGIMIIGFNILAFINWLIQRRIDKSI